MLCKASGESLGSSLVRLSLSETSNGAKHLNRAHKEELVARDRETNKKLATQIAKRVCCPSQHFADLFYFVL